MIVDITPIPAAEARLILRFAAEAPHVASRFDRVELGMADAALMASAGAFAETRAELRDLARRCVRLSVAASGEVATALRFVAGVLFRAARGAAVEMLGGGDLEPDHRLAAFQSPPAIRISADAGTLLLVEKVRSSEAIAAAWKALAQLRARRIAALLKDNRAESMRLANEASAPLSALRALGIDPDAADEPGQVQP